VFFVHGYYSSLEDTLKLVSQMFALGSFPAYVVPVIFGWPCTSMLSYMFVRCPAHTALHQPAAKHGIARSCHCFAHAQTAPLSRSCTPCAHESSLLLSSHAVHALQGTAASCCVHTFAHAWPPMWQHWGHQRCSAGSWM
jgi:hypothetical protein